VDGSYRWTYVTVVNCHSRRFVGWTLRLGRNVMWSVCGWTDRQGTNQKCEGTLSKLPLYQPGIAYYKCCLLNAKGSQELQRSHAPGHLVSLPGARAVPEPGASTVSPVRQANTSCLPSLLGLHRLLCSLLLGLLLPIAPLGGLHMWAAVADRGHSQFSQKAVKKKTREQDAFSVSLGHTFSMAAISCEGFLPPTPACRKATPPAGNQSADGLTEALL
jgi:hypothetical protein